uniref:Centromere protein R n=1 Tax=Caenorhabditis tropicalis TaxID=1561998 RepID=A0A1I7UJH0_9PELO
MQKRTLTQEERQARIKESRQTYGRKPPRRSRSLDPRTSIAPGLKTSGTITTRPVTRPVPFNFDKNRFRSSESTNHASRLPGKNSVRKEEIHQKAVTPNVLKQNEQLKKNCLLATARKLNFDDTTLNETVKENLKPINEVANSLRNILTNAETLLLSSQKFSQNELKTLAHCLKVLHIVEFKNKMETKKLVPISENEPTSENND